MRSWLLLVFLAACLSLALARNGSISNDIFDDDVNDDEPDDEPEPEIKDGRKPSACARKKCHRGEVCHVNSKGNAECVCTPDCDFYRKSPATTRLQVCSNKNMTYPTECDLDREHCLCKRKQEGCTFKNVKKIQLEYYGDCQELKQCTEGSRKQFPDRLKNWLYIVMEEMAERAKMGEYEDLLKEAEEDANHYYAAIWGFCDLDKDPQDRHVSRRELQYTVRSLKAFEQCLVPFLDDCDADDDRKITLNEWGKCLRVPEDHISDRCKKIHKHKGRGGKKSRK